MKLEDLVPNTDHPVWQTELIVHPLVPLCVFAGLVYFYTGIASARWYYRLHGWEIDKYHDRGLVVFYCLVWGFAWPLRWIARILFLPFLGLYYLVIAGNKMKGPSA